MKELQSKINVQPIVKTTTEPKIRKWQSCKTGNLHTILIFDKRGPPAWYLGGSHSSSSYES